MSNKRRVHGDILAAQQERQRRRWNRRANRGALGQRTVDAAARGQNRRRNKQARRSRKANR